jgi:hypothetical protein
LIRRRPKCAITHEAFWRRNFVCNPTRIHLIFEYGEERPSERLGYVEKELRLS